MASASGADTIFGGVGSNTAGGSTVLTLPDNTRITLLGVTGLRADAFA